MQAYIWIEILQMKINNLEEKRCGRIMSPVEKILKLINSEISAYRISKDTGIPQSKLSRIKSGKIKINNIQLGTALKLSQYYDDMVHDKK